MLHTKVHQRKVSIQGCRFHAGTVPDLQLGSPFSPFFLVSMLLLVYAHHSEMSTRYDRLARTKQLYSS